VDLKYDYQSICASIDAMSEWQHKAMCAVNFEKILPVVKCLSLSPTSRIVEQSIVLSWDSVTKKVRRNECRKLLNDLHQTPEWNCDDSDNLLHIVAQWLSLVEFSLNAACSIDTVRQAKVSTGLILDFTDPFQASNLPQRTTEGKKLSKTNIMTSEKQSQQRLVSILLKADQPNLQLLDVLQHEAAKVAELFLLLLPWYCHDQAGRLIRLDSTRRELQARLLRN
jgi:hypothetical protein